MSGRGAHWMYALRAALLAVTACGLLALDALPAVASEAGVGWEAFTQAYPTVLHPGGAGTIQIDLMNIGAKTSEGAITVTDTLPEGMTATMAGGMVPLGAYHVSNRAMTEAEEIKEVGGVRWRCEGIGGRRVTCTSNPAYLPSLPSGKGEDFNPVERLAVAVEVKEGTSGRLINEVTMSGGGATSSTVVNQPITVAAGEAEFGVSGWDVWFSNANGGIDTEAGSHPYETTFAVGFNEMADGDVAGGQVRNLEAELPPGFFGEPNTTPRCTRAQVDTATLKPPECPADTQIGYDIALTNEKQPGGAVGYYRLPVYNMVPPEGVADEFAVDIAGHTVFYDTDARGSAPYNLVTRIDNVPDAYLDGNILILWGVASEPSHDAGRIIGGETPEAIQCQKEGCPSPASPRPFLTLPTACEGSQEFTIRRHGSWEDEQLFAEASVGTHNALDEPLGFTGCALLSFNPGLSVTPDAGEADMPTGLGVDVSFPQEALRTPGERVEATVKDTSVTLPEGLVINPGQAAGLVACSTVQAKLQDEGAPECPLAAKVGTVKIQTPLLEGELETELDGDVYVLEQSRGGSGERPNLRSHPPTIQLLIAVEGDGIHLKLVAEVHMSEATGRLTTTLVETPGLPFTHFELQFSGGAQAALASPVRCGAYSTISDFTPWTSPFASDMYPASTFRIDGGPEGSQCPSSPLPFKPELIAGATTDQAGGFTGFSLLLRRGDGQQRIEKLRFKMPEGLTGVLSKVPLCPEPQAQNGECSSASQIGHATVASGPGPYPLVIPEPGNPESPIYLTGSYDGAPFGLSIVTHVIAGPFNLGTIVTRAKIEINPVTAQITVTTEPLPQIVDGVPTDLRLIDSVIDRPGFMVNPTDCEPMSFSGTAWGAAPPGLFEPEDEASISSRFQVGSCRSLEFKPQFKVTTQAKTSKRDGASLEVHLSFPKEALGHDANIREVKVELPKQLPSRLETLQKACLAEVFDANPARCPAESRVGFARAMTQILPVPLAGPAYFVSYGGAKFPELVIVLQGDGVTIDLHGETFINAKTSVTSSTFKSVPDQPVETFELTLPEGKYSALGASADLCQAGKTIVVTKRVRRKIDGHWLWVNVKAKHKVSGLSMPTTFIGQDGAVVHQATAVVVTGCGKVDRATAGRHGDQTRRKHSRR